MSANDTVTMAVTISDDSAHEVMLEVIGTRASVDARGLAIRNGPTVVLAVPLPYFFKLEIPG